MKQHLLFVGFFLGTTFSFGQAPTISWQKTLGGTAYDQGESVQPTLDGGYIVCGIATSNNGNVTGNHGFGDVWVVKLDSDGNIQWQHAYGGSNDDGGFSIVQTPDGGYVIAGTSTSTNGDATTNYGGVDWWIIKMNATGVLQWQKSYGGSNTDIPYEIQVTADHGFVAVGYTNSTAGNVTGNHGGEDYWVVKMDSAGNLQWQKTLGGSLQDRGLSIRQTTDQGYAVCGFTYSNDGDVTGNHGGSDCWVVKLNSGGALVWQHVFGGTSDDQANSVRQTLDGGFVFGGQTASSNGDVTFNHGFTDLWLVKLNSAGMLQWQQSLGGTMVDQAYAVRQTPDGNYVAVGSSFSSDGQVTGNHGGYDYWFVKANAIGNIIWQKSLGGTSVEEALCVEVTDSGYAVCGGTLSNDGDVSGNHGDFDYWVLSVPDAFAVLLPVELISFSGRSHWDGNILEWKTASELDNERFTVWKSADGKTYNSIGSINGVGSALVESSYSFIDTFPSNPVTYYKLEQTDFDQTSTFSQVIAVENDAPRLRSLSVFPNPASGYFDIVIPATEHFSDVKIVTCLGAVVHSQAIEPSKTGHAIRLNTSHLTDGLYWIFCSHFDASVVLVVQ
jgi:hypothetical protein